MTPAQVRKLLVVGGGVGGMSLAIRCRQMGIDVDLIDLDPNWRVYGTGITLSGPSMRALKVLGVIDEVLAQGHAADDVHICDAGGAVVQKIPTPRLAGPDIPGGGGIMRPVLHAILSKEVLRLGTKVRLGLTVDRVEQLADGARAMFSDGSRADYDLVVGADGVNSHVRALLFPDAPKPAYTGQGIWRVLVDRPPEIERPTMYVGYHVKVGFTPVSDRQMYLYCLLNLPDNPWLDEEQSLRLLREQLGGFAGVVSRIREELGPDSPIIYRPLEKLLLPKPWHQGRVVLLGDAAHSTTPHLASGAGIAIEDALVLAEEFARQPGVEAALEAYVERRFERCRLVVENSVRLGQMDIERAPAADHSALMRDSMVALAGAM